MISVMEIISNNVILGNIAYNNITKVSIVTDNIIELYSDNNEGTTDFTIDAIRSYYTEINAKIRVLFESNNLNIEQDMEIYPEYFL